MNYKELLNESQLEAVTSSLQYLRIVAGAGSGKTRVLTYRIAYLISELHVDPYKILAITFTNKVAGEMKSRVLDIVPEAHKDLTIRTYHSLAARFLRHEISSIGFPNDFTILDEEDQEKLLKEIGVSLGYKKKDEIMKRAINYIGSKKCEGLYPEDIVIKNESFYGEKECLKIFKLYEEKKNSMYSLDFDDLLLKTIHILESFDDIRQRWVKRIDYILIDEFQDTNDIQYKLIRLLSKNSTSLYVVGDPDQTIYSWRGANQHIIMDIEKDYPLMETIILDRNYRSTQEILNASNKLISYNKYRVKKNLYTNNHVGDKVITYKGYSAKDESNYIAKEILKLKREGYLYHDIAILYRSNYLTLDVEQALTQNAIPYRIFGGLRFYQRKEVKDVLAYFSLIVNPKNDLAFERIVNVPRRAIGDETFETIKKEAEKRHLSLFNYSCDISDDSTLKPRVKDALKDLSDKVNKAKDKLNENVEVFSKVLEDMIVSLGYYDYLALDDDGKDRLENVKQLFGDLRNYLVRNPESTFDEYLQNIALISAQDDIVEGDYVSLMTVHTAKGLEYPIIFVIRLNDGIFPNNRAMEEGYLGLEEERRLCYVAFTRARERLYVTCNTGFNYVVGSGLIPSRFYFESGLIIKRDNISTKQKEYHFGFNTGEKQQKYFPDEPIQQDFSLKTNGINDWSVGDEVIHKKLGKGKVIAVEEDGIIQVNFESEGIKSILGNHPMVSKGKANNQA